MTGFMSIAEEGEAVGVVEKKMLAGPVVSLLVIQRGDIEEKPKCIREGDARKCEKGEVCLVLAAVGPNLIFYSLSCPMTTCLDCPSSVSSVPAVLPVFDSHNISHIKLVQEQTNDLVMIFGYKSFALLQIDFRCPQKSIVLDRIDPLQDMLLDARLDHVEGESLILLGFAQNILQVYSRTQRCILWTIKCPVVCVLFSFAMAPTSSINSEVTIASGTAMGEIVLWKSSFNYGGGACTPQSHVIHTLSGHTGIVWKVRWNHALDKIVSVSDDRTVRVWNTSQGVQVFCGFGHSCRVWDCMFIGRCDAAVVTCGEDSTLKVWDLQSHQCVSTLQGHAGKHIWCLSELKVKVGASDEKETVIVSGGNDGALNFWHISSQYRLCPDGRSGDSIEALEARMQVAHQDIMCGSPSNYLQDKVESVKLGVIIAHRLSPCGSVLIAVSQDAVWITSSAPAALQFQNVLSSDRNINAADVCFSTTNNNTSEWAIQCVLAHKGGYTTFMKLSFDASENAATLLDVCQWKAHDLNSMCVVLLSPRSDAASEEVVFMTMSVKGECRVWKVTHVDSIAYHCIMSLQTPKCNIATSASMLSSKEWLAIGDCRGNITLFHCLEAHCDEKRCNLSPKQYFPKVHGMEVVTQIQEVAGGFCSLGNDGFLVVFSANSSACDGSAVPYRMISKVSCSPITSPDQLFISHGSSHPSSPPVCVVGGYQSTEYIVFDLFRNYQLLRVSAGGWKRPHRCAVEFNAQTNHFPCVTFVSSMASETTTLYSLLQYNPFKVPALYDIPLQLGVPGLAKVGYCAAFCRHGEAHSQLVAVGTEGGTVRAFGCGASCRLSDFTLLQEVEMPFHVGVRALAWCAGKDNSPGVLIAGGGRLAYSIWLCRQGDQWGGAPLRQVLEQVHSTSDDHAQSCRRAKRAKSDSSSQDHRILAIGAVPLRAHQILVVFCDSRGVARVVLVDSQSSPASNRGEKAATLNATVTVGNQCRASLREIESFEASAYPLLSCSLVSVQLGEGDYVAKAMVGVVGDTAGQVKVWLLSASTVMNRTLSETSKLLLSYHAHTMGANTLCCQKTKLAPVKSPLGRGWEQHLTVCSGGDDQSITITTLSIAFKIAETVSCRISMRVLSTHRVNGASGSAIKGIHLMPNRDMCVSVGYDQRLSVWSVSSDEISSDDRVSAENRVISVYEGSLPHSSTEEITCKSSDNHLSVSTLELQKADVDEYVANGDHSSSACPLKWRSGVMVNVGDVNGMAVSEGGFVAVVGEGLQLLELS